MKKIDFILVIIVGFVFINMSNKITTLENKLDEMQGTLQEVYRYSEESSSMINETISQNKLVNNIGFKFKGADKQMSMLDVSIDLNKKNEDSEVRFLYKESDKNDWIEVDTIEKSTLSYSTKIEVDQTKLYEYKVCLIGEENQSSEKFYLDESIYGPQVLEYSSSWSQSDFEISIAKEELEKKHLGFFELSELYLKVNSDDEIHEIDLDESNNYSVQINDKSMLSPGTKIYLVSKYTNGLVNEILISEH